MRSAPCRQTRSWLTEQQAPPERRGRRPAPGDLAALPAGPLPPPSWPAGLHWTPEWSALLDPSQPTSCFIYPEGRASQWNAFEADAVAALLWLLHGRLANRLRDDRDPEGAPLPPGDTPYTTTEFFTTAVGS